MPFYLADLELINLPQNILLNLYKWNPTRLTDQSDITPIKNTL